VVIDGEFGHIEEFTSTYVVVRLWDRRRQIVPLEWFSENIFTNWTRSTASLIGTVMFYLDYAAPIDRIRRKAEEIAKASPLWNQQVFAVQVTDTKEHTIEVRILVSANDSGKTFDLRAEMREKLLSWLQSEIPTALPRNRNEVYPAPEQRREAAE
jgi:small-conductance mechanosensitive channel